MPGDNFFVEVHSDIRSHFESAVRMAWVNAPGGRATHYITLLPENGDKKVAMVLLWNEDLVRGVKATKLPFPLECDAAIEFLWSWLKTLNLGSEPDHDGDNKAGFIVTTGNSWGHVEDSPYAFIGVYPSWQMYGK